jgi:hypothetical protein
MSDHHCDICHEFIVNCYHFRICHITCDNKVYNDDMRILCRYTFIILQAARSACMRDARVSSTQRAIRNSLHDISPVAKPLMNIIAGYL